MPAPELSRLPQPPVPSDPMALMTTTPQGAVARREGEGEEVDSTRSADWFSEAAAVDRSVLQIKNH